MSDVKANKRAALYTRPERGLCAYCLASAMGWDYVVHITLILELV